MIELEYITWKKLI